MKQVLFKPKPFFFVGDVVLFKDKLLLFKAMTPLFNGKPFLFNGGRLLFKRYFAFSSTINFGNLLEHPVIARP
ncbi:MAG: hypothetical protein ACP5G4_01395 [bacterium]